MSTLDTKTSHMDVKEQIISEEAAVGILHRFLGGPFIEWHNFLINDRAYSGEILFITNPDGIYYDESDIFEYIAYYNPSSLGFESADNKGSVIGSTFTIDAQICVDYAHAGKLVIEIETPRTSHGVRWISPGAAREFATKLMLLAQQCEEHEFNYDGWVITKPGEEVTSRMKKTTGDRELDLLLSELDGDENLKAMVLSEVIA